MVLSKTILSRRAVFVLILLTSTWNCAFSRFIPPGTRSVLLEERSHLSDVSGVLNSMLEAAGLLSEQCTLLLLSEQPLMADDLFQSLRYRPSRPATAIFSLTPSPEEVARVSNISELLQNHYRKTLTKARELRLQSWCTGVLYFATKFPPNYSLRDTLTELTVFGKESLVNRLLVWDTKLFIITESLEDADIEELMQSSWTYSMMNSVLANVHSKSRKWRVWRHEPYPSTSTSRRKTKVVAYGAGNNNVTTNKLMFREKFTNFKGSELNVTALPFAPYWNTGPPIEYPNGTSVPTFMGTDYELLKALSQVLNFNIRVLDAKDWDQVTDLVEQRVSFVATVIYAVFPQRLKKFDFTMIFEHAFLGFSMAKPGLKPRWLSLYYPLTHEVWLAVLITLFVVPIFFWLFVPSQIELTSLELRQKLLTNYSPATYEDKFKQASYGRGFQENLAALLGQSSSAVYYQSVSCQMFACSWQIFAFIVSVAYRSNLTAYLTYPVYPPRPESLPELVQSGAGVTMPPYGVTFRDYFLSSSSQDFRALGERFSFVNSISEGLERELHEKSAHIEPKRYQQLVIAEQFTQADGSTRIYIGRDSITGGLSAWPVPHDAPYKHILNGWIQVVLEAGLYEKWSRDLIAEAQRNSRRRLLQAQQNTTQQQSKGPPSNLPGVEALSLDHLQGPLYIVLLGCGVAFLVFLSEYYVKRFKWKKST